MRRAAIAGITLVAVVGMAEAIARYEGFADPLLYRAAQSGYEITPAQTIDQMGSVTHINAIGTRGGDVQPATPAQTSRIMVLGDSVANGGTHLQDRETFPAVAADALNHRGCRAEILNASAGGWSLFDEAAWIHQHGLANASMLVWTINSLDLDQPPSTPAILDHNPSFPSHRPATALGAILFRYVLPRLGIGPSAADNGSLNGSSFDRRQFAAVSQLVTATKHEMDQRGVRMIVLFHDTLTAQPADRLSARADFLRMLDAQAIPVMMTNLAQAPDAAQLYRDTIHPNARGYAVIGKNLADALQQQCPKTAQALR